MFQFILNLLVTHSTSAGFIVSFRDGSNTFVTHSGNPLYFAVTNVGGKDNKGYMMFKNKKGDTIEISEKESPQNHFHPGEKGFDEAKNKIIENEKKKDEK